MRTKYKYARIVFAGIMIACIARVARAQQVDSIVNQAWNIHGQFTFITQYHPAFHAAYSGKNSLSDSSDHESSLTFTLFIGRRLWRNAAVYFSPEVSGGLGFNDARGIAGFTNGDIYRVDNPTPQGYVARLYLIQYIPLGGSSDVQPDEPLQLGGYVPSRRLEVIAGKLSMTDLFDDNPVSHDPRTQFLNWSIMDDGAWDFPADTRGYDAIVSLGYVTPHWTIRMAEALEPTYANGSTLNWNLHRSHSETIECTYTGTWRQHPLFAGIHVYNNFTPAPEYAAVVRAKKLGTDTTMDVIDPSPVSHSKYGVGVSMSYTANARVQTFLRAGWNDGHTATWAFTEIDRSISAGGMYQIPLPSRQKYWQRSDRFLQIGCAFVVNGLSAPHREFLEAGGYGFVIGDGKLRYATENIAELYALFPLHQLITLTGDFQWIVHPAYNRDRGPVAVGSIRLHVAF